MANKEINIKVKTETSGLTQLRNELKAVKSELLEATDPNRMVELNARAAELTDSMADLNEEVKAFQGSKFEQVSGSLGNIKNSLMNLDFERASQQAKTFGDITKTMTMKEMIGGIKNLGSTLMNLGKAILLNPIFLIATVVLLIVKAIYDWAEANGYITKAMDMLKEGLAILVGWIEDGIIWIREMIAKFDELGTVAKIVIGIFMGPFVAAIYAVTKALEYFGVIDDVETQKLKKKNAEKITNIKNVTAVTIAEIDKRIKKMKEESDNVDSELQFQKKLQAAKGKDTTEIDRLILANKKKMLEEELVLIQEKIKAEFLANYEILKLQAQTSTVFKGVLAATDDLIKKAGGMESYIETSIGSNDDIKAIKENLKEVGQDIEIFEAGVTKTKRDAADKRKEADAKDAEDREKERLKEQEAIRADLQKQLDIYNQFRQDYYELNKGLSNELEELGKSDFDLKVLNIDREKAAREQQLLDLLNSDAITAEEYFKTLENLETIYDDKFNKVIKERDDKQKDEQEKADKKEKADKLANFTSDVDMAQQSLNAISSLTNMFAAKNEKQARAQFAVNKALNIGSAVMNTALGVTKALATLPPPASFVTAATTAAMGAANIVKIASSKFGGGASSGSSMGGGSSSPSIPSNIDRALPNVSFTGGNNQNTVSAGGTNMTVTAIVSETEMTSVQERNEKRKINAEL
jgi:hypothetical protein